MNNGTGNFITAEAPINIALIKYWGKRDKRLNLPITSSFSITLQVEEPDNDVNLISRTTITILSPDENDRIVFNGDNIPINDRIRRMLGYIRAITDLPPIQVESRNYFPTGAGLASSASGLAALSKALSGIVKLSEAQQYTIARLGSGSACRSMLGGFVKWWRGQLDDGSDSLPRQLYPPNHWPELTCTVFILEGREKFVASGIGMEQTVYTSDLFSRRTDLVESKVDVLLEAIDDRNFPRFAEIIMRDSNQFHAVCLDTYPPLVYLNDQSNLVMRAIHALNAGQGREVAAYTFDAGPNAFVFYLQKDRDLVEQAVKASLKSLGSIKVVRCKVGEGARVTSC